MVSVARLWGALHRRAAAGLQWGSAQLLNRLLPPHPQKCERVLEFFTHYPGFRLLHQCARETGLALDECYRIKLYLYSRNLLGGYTLEANTPPQRHMRQAILDKFPEITPDSRILEIGPGATPVFPAEAYPHWRGLDKHLESDGQIHFHADEWQTPDSYNGRILQGSWENMVASLQTAGIEEPFDLVVASHSYEHVFQPILALKQAAAALKPGGFLVLFVPNGYSDEPAARGEMTHTLFLVPEMIREFFDCSGCFAEVEIRNFRPNYDFLVTARRMTNPSPPSSL